MVFVRVHVGNVHVTRAGDTRCNMVRSRKQRDAGLRTSVEFACRRISRGLIDESALRQHVGIERRDVARDDDVACVRASREIHGAVRGGRAHCSVMEDAAAVIRAGCQDDEIHDFELLINRDIVRGAEVRIAREDVVVRGDGTSAGSHLDALGSDDDLADERVVFHHDAACVECHVVAEAAAADEHRAHAVFGAANGDLREAVLQRVYVHIAEVEQASRRRRTDIDSGRREVGTEDQIRSSLHRVGAAEEVDFISFQARVAAVCTEDGTCENLLRCADIDIRRRRHAFEASRAAAVRLDEVAGDGDLALERGVQRGVDDEVVGDAREADDADISGSCEVRIRRCRGERAACEKAVSNEQHFARGDRAVQRHVFRADDAERLRNRRLSANGHIARRGDGEPANRGREVAASHERAARDGGVCNAHRAVERDDGAARNRE